MMALAGSGFELECFRFYGIKIREQKSGSRIDPATWRGHAASAVSSVREGNLPVRQRPNLQFSSALVFYLLPEVEIRIAPAV